MAVDTKKGRKQGGVPSFVILEIFLLRFFAPILGGFHHNQVATPYIIIHIIVNQLFKKIFELIYFLID